MSKHNRMELEKKERNKVFARQFRQLKCEECSHRSSVAGRCAMCGGRIKHGDYARAVKMEDR